LTLRAGRPAPAPIEDEWFRLSKELLSMKHFLGTFAGLFRSARARKPARPARRSLRPRFEVLEDRAVPTTLPSGFHETLVAGGLGSPMAMALAPDGRGFGTTQGIANNGTLPAAPFLRLSGAGAKLQTPVADSTVDPGPPPGTPPPVSPGNGQVPGVTLPGGGSLYYAEDAQLAGFAWFDTLHGWFPDVLHSTNAQSPGHLVVDMAYADQGSMTFFNVNAPTAGVYQVSFRYAFASGLFPGINDREMGLSVNGQVVLDPMHFPITHSFETYSNSSALVQLNQGQNDISLFNISEHGVSRVDTMTVTPVSSTTPAAPTGVTALAGNNQVNLSWTAVTGATGYNVYRGTSSGTETLVAAATNISGATFTDNSATNGTQYFYYVTALNGSLQSGPSSEVSATPKTPTTGSLVQAISAGGGAAGSFVADTDFSGGAVSHGTSAAINTGAVTNPPPQSVLQHGRYGNFTYTIPNLTPGASYTVRLDFVEYAFNAAGARVFNVAINGAPVLSNFDIWVAAGGQDMALAKSFSATASTAGTITIGFHSLVNNSIVSGIEIYATSQAAALPLAPVIASAVGPASHPSAPTLITRRGSTTVALESPTVDGANSHAAGSGSARWNRSVKKLNRRDIDSLT
jgi:hypothetical protein